MTIADINALDKEEFVKALSGIYESSPWIPSRTFEQTPFDDLEELLVSLHQTVEKSNQSEKLDLIQAHPDLGGKLGVKSALTAESQQEQNRLGLDSLGEKEYQEFSQLNQDYRNKFGFPFIICVGKVAHRDEILAAFRSRLNNNEKQEFTEALNQVHEIARLRLEALLPSTH